MHFFLKHIHANLILTGKIITFYIILIELLISSKYKFSGNEDITRNKNLFKGFNVWFFSKSSLIMKVWFTPPIMKVWFMSQQIWPDNEDFYIIMWAEIDCETILFSINCAFQFFKYIFLCVSSLYLIWDST